MMNDYFISLFPPEFVRFAILFNNNIIREYCHSSEFVDTTPTGCVSGIWRELKSYTMIPKFPNSPKPPMYLSAIRSAIVANKVRILFPVEKMGKVHSLMEIYIKYNTTFLHRWWKEEPERHDYYVSFRDRQQQKYREKGTHCTFSIPPIEILKTFSERIDSATTLDEISISCAYLQMFLSVNIPTVLLFARTE